jgi:predicted nucleotidyltransferase
MTAATDLRRDEIIAGLKRLEPALRQKGVTGLAMFGSRARGDHRPDSDLDVLVEIGDDLRFSLLDLIGIERAITDAIGLQAQAEMRRSLEPRFRERITDDIIEVF